MNTGKTLFSQLMDFLPTHEFNRCVHRYRGNHRVRRFSCRDQFLSMAFAQLTFRESLRDIETCLKSIQHKLYHSGFRSTVARIRWPGPTRNATGASTPIWPIG